MNQDLNHCNFPVRLYHMLEDASLLGFEAVVSWNKQGNGFIIHDRKKFTEETMKTYFSHTQWKSFLRQLNFYSFQRLSKRGQGVESCYAHPLLQRGDIARCKHIRRSKRDEKSDPRSFKQAKTMDGSEQSTKTETKIPLQLIFKTEQGSAHEEMGSSYNPIASHMFADNSMSLGGDMDSTLSFISGSIAGNLSAPLDALGSTHPDYTDKRMLQNHFSPEMADAIVLTFLQCSE